MDVLFTILWVLEETGDKWFLGVAHQLNNAVLDGILVLVQPSVGVVLHLKLQNSSLYCYEFCNYKKE